MSSNFCVKFATQIQFCVATKTILSSKLRCKPDYFGHCNFTNKYAMRYNIINKNLIQHNLQTCNKI